MQKWMPLRLSLSLCAFARNGLFGYLIFLCFVVPNAHANGHAQVTIKVSPSREMLIEARSTTPADSWSFRNAYAGVLGIAERITDFRATTSSEQDAGAKKIATGEFRSDLDATRITYEVKVSEITAANV